MDPFHDRPPRVVGAVVGPVSLAMMKATMKVNATMAVVKPTPGDGRYSLCKPLAAIGPEEMLAIAGEGVVVAIIHDVQSAGIGVRRAGRANDDDPP